MTKQWDSAQQQCCDLRPRRVVVETRRRRPHQLELSDVDALANAFLATSSGVPVSAPTMRQSALPGRTATGIT
jgi:hypothetical protein